MKIPRLRYHLESNAIDKDGDLLKGYTCKDHPFYKTSNDMYDRLVDIKNNKTSYCSFDMSLLCNCLEIYYKLYLMHHKIHYRNETRYSHKVSSLYKVIYHNNISNPNLTKSDNRSIFRYLYDLDCVYSDTRYSGMEIQKKYFLEGLEFLKENREFILSQIDPTREWDIEHNEELAR